MLLMNVFVYEILIQCLELSVKEKTEFFIKIQIIYFLGGLNTQPVKRLKRTVNIYIYLKKLFYSYI
jgi:hypothetical protein